MNTLTQRDMRLKLGKVSNLPSIPQVILKIKQISENPKSSAADLANCILSDHQLTSRILRMANSAYYGDFAGRINTVTQGIVLMGFRAVRNIAISMAVFEVVNKVSRKSSFDIKAFWTRSLACGVIAKFLAQEINRPKLAELAFIAGFMHDIGQAILAGAFPDKYEQIDKLDAASAEIYKTESVILGIDHLQAGAFVAGEWNLPEALIKPISEHHRLDKVPGEKSEHILVDLVYLGDRLYTHVMSGTPLTSTTYGLLIEEAQSLIGISEASMAELLTVCREQIADIAKDLEIDIKSEFSRGPVIEGDDDDIRQQLSSKEVQLAFLQNATGALMDAKGTDEIQQIICESAFRGLQMGRVMLFGYDEQWNSFSGRVGFGMESQKAVKALKFSAKAGLFKHLKDKAKAITVVSDDQNVYGNLISREERELLEAHAFVAIPLKIAGEVQYVLFADAPRRETPIGAESLRSLISLANQGAMSLERDMLMQKLNQASPDHTSVS